MAPPKAVAWPEEIYDDADVLSLDEQGRFVVCRVCAQSFEIFGGKTPKPVNMNACFRTCAWETYKRRTNAHRWVERIRSSSSHSASSRERSPPTTSSGRLSMVVQQPAAEQSTEMRPFDRQHALAAAINRIYERESSSAQMEANTGSFQQLLASAQSQEDSRNLVVSSGDRREDAATQALAAAPPLSVGTVSGLHVTARLPTAAED